MMIKGTTRTHQMFLFCHPEPTRDLNLIFMRLRLDPSTALGMMGKRTVLFASALLEMMGERTLLFASALLGMMGVVALHLLPSFRPKREERARSGEIQANRRIEVKQNK